MNPRHLRSLLAVEVRRNRKNFLTTLGIAGIGLPLLGVFSPLKTETILWMMCAAAMFLGMAVPANIIKDKLTGHLEFMTTLPARSSALAVSAFLATALGVVPLAVLAAGAISWAVLPALGIGGGVWWSLGMALAVWVVYAAGSFLLLSTVIRFDVNKVGWVPIVIFPLLFLFGDPVEEWIISRAPAAVDFLAANPALARTLATVLFLLLGASPFVVGFFLIRQGFERYRPKPDAIDW